MSFDRTDPADLAALKTEVETDPIGMGYAAVVNVTAQLLKLLNDPANNVAGDTAARVFDAGAMLDALEPAELDAQQTTAGAMDYVNGLLQYAESQGSIERFKAKFRSLFAANSDTVVALDAQSAPLSRAEVLFGQGTVLTSTDWFAARDS